MQVSLDMRSFQKQMNNLVDYSIGFLDGTKFGKNLFLSQLGKGTIQALSLYIDSMARSNTQALHHVYEWYRTGSPSARLFDINYTVAGSGLSFGSTFKQSRTMSKDATTAFYNKARIMENGISVKIKPKKSSVLVFQQDGETIFTKNEVDIKNPGGPAVAGSFEKTFDSFFKNYFSQSFLRASGVLDYLENPNLYKTNLSSGVKGGKQEGLSTGYKWITSAKIGIE